MFPRFEQFISEKQYLQNVTPATVDWYRYSLRWLRTESPTDADLKDVVLRMRARGLKPSGCNCHIRAINSFLHWNVMGMDVKCSPLCKHPRIMSMKEPTLVLPVYTAQQVQKLVGFRPKGFYELRMHLLVLILLDTGCRISEALGLHVADVDLDNLLMTLDGKGGKQRKVPFSMELRKGLFRYTREFCPQPHMLVLGTRHGLKLDRHIVARDVRLFCQRLGFAAPARVLHAFRHTFAVNYLRKGGGVFHLQRVLGHSSLEMTRRYANLMTEDLQAIHQRVSLLAA